MEILHRDALKQGGFAGVREHQLVKDNKLFGAPPKPGQGWSGIGNFVYLADARFIPHGETGMHPHKEVDVISVMVSGRISHAGSLEHGQELHAFEVQVQRAGGEGFYHNEINPDPTENRMLQLWVLPEEAGQKAGYKMYQPEQGRMGLVYGGADDQTDTFAAKTQIEVGRLKAGNRVDFSAPFLAYLSLGTGIANGLEVKAGHLFKDNRLDFEAKEDALLIVITS